MLLPTPEVTALTQRLYDNNPPPVDETTPDTIDPWPPVPPDMDMATLQPLLEKPALSFSPGGQIYKLKDLPLVLKFGATRREHTLQTAAAAADCALPVHGKALSKYPCGTISFNGILMPLARPLPKNTHTLPLPERRELMHQMLHTVQKLHTASGIVHGDVKLDNMMLLTTNQNQLRLSDFGEARYVTEDERVWEMEGRSTWHYESPNRLVRGEQRGQDPAAPVVEDDLYGLGLAIWELYTGKVANGDLVGDDLGLKERQREGGTVDVGEVEDEEAREIIKGLLRKGGARI